MQQLSNLKKTQLGEIPQEWEVSSVDSFLKINMGQSPPSETYNDQKKGLPFYQGVSDFNEIFPIPRIWCSIPKKIANPNEILFSVRAPVGELNLTNEKCCIGRGIASLIPIHSDLKYCFYLLKLFKYKFNAYSQGSTFEAINRDQIGRVRLPFTQNIAEQQKIASIISKVDELIQKTDQIIEYAQRLEKGLLQMLLTKGIGHTKFMNTELGDIPEEWTFVKLGDIIEDIRYGTSIKCSSRPNGIPILRIPNIVKGLNFDDLKYASLTKEELKRLQVDEGDILFVRTNGNKEYVGRTITFPKMDTPHAFASYLIKVKLSKGKVNPYFFNYQLRLSRLKNQILNNIKTSAGQYNLNAEGIKALNIVLPSLKEQQKIASIISKVDELIHIQLIYMSKIKGLKTGLMQNLLTGKIRVKT
jgi:type I restriction enzyme S subunit